MKKDLTHVWVVLALLIALSMLLCGCRTEYYESGKVKSEGFHLGTTGLGNYSLISVEIADKEE